MSDYNGYTNYETWATALWIDNDQNDAREVQSMTSAAIRDAVPTYEGQAPERYIRADVAESLQAYVTETMCPYLGSSLASDLLTHALGGVNWHELADLYIDQCADLEVSADTEGN